MKRKFRLVIILISVIIVLTAFGFWRHHYLKIMNAEPVIVYKVPPFEPDTSPKDTSTKKEQADNRTPSDTETLPKDMSTDNENNTDVVSEPRKTTQPIDNSFTPDEMDNTGNPSVHHIFTDIVVENLPPKVAAVLKEYEEIQLAIPKLNEELKPLLEARPIDFDAIDVINEKKRVLSDQRKDALEILSKYSNEASEELQATIKREKAAERIMEEMDEDPDMDFDDIKQRLEELTK